MKCRLLALSETRLALPPPSPFSLPHSSFLLHCPPVHPSILFLPFKLFFSFTLFSFSRFESLSASLAFSSSSLFLPLLSPCTLFLSLYCPHDFYYCPPSFIQAYLTGFCCVTPLSMILSFSITLLHSSTFPALYMSICFVQRRGSPQKQPVFSSVYSPCCVLYFSDHMKRQNSYRSRKGNIFSRCLLHTSTATMTVTY